MKKESKYNYKLLKEIINSNILNKEIYDKVIDELNSYKYDKVELNGMNFLCSSKTSNRTLSISIFDNLSNDTLKIGYNLVDDSYYNKIIINKLEDNKIYVYQNEKFSLNNYYVKKRLYNNNSLVYEELLEDYDGIIRYNEKIIRLNNGVKKVICDKKENYYKFSLENNINCDTRLNDSNNYCYTSKNIYKEDYNNMSRSKEDILKLIKTL